MYFCAPGYHVVVVFMLKTPNISCCSLFASEKLLLQLLYFGRIELSYPKVGLGAE